MASSSSGEGRDFAVSLKSSFVYRASSSSEWIRRGAPTESSQLDSPVMCSWCYPFIPVGGIVVLFMRQERPDIDVPLWARSLPRVNDG